MTTLPASSRRCVSFGVMFCDLGFGVNAVGDDAGLRAGQRHRRNADRLQRHRRQRDGRLLAGGEQHVHLALRRRVHDLLGELDEAVGHAAHRRDHDDDLIPARPAFADAPGDVLDPLGVADRGAAVFLNDERHVLVKDPITVVRSLVVGPSGREP